MLDMTTIFHKFPVLDTERFILRAVQDGDAPDIFRIMSDDRVTRYLGQHPMTTMEQAAQRVSRYHDSFRTQAGIPWAITPRGEQRVIGTCVFWNFVPEHDRAEVGYILSPDWWGKGVMREAVRAQLDFGFDVMGLHSVEAQLDPENTASRRLLEALGFVQEGYFREDYFHPIEQRFTDTLYYSLVKSTWISHKDAVTGN